MVVPKRAGTREPAGGRAHGDEERRRGERRRPGPRARRRREARERGWVLAELAALMARNPFLDG